MAWKAAAQADLHALAAECRASGSGLTGWLIGGASQHVNVAEAVTSALARLREEDLPTPCEEVAHPFLLACAVQHSALCKLGLASLERLLALDALSDESVARLVSRLHKLDESEDEATLLKALQTALSLFQSRPGCVPQHVRPLFSFGLRALSAHASGAVHATAAAALRQGCAALLERAACDAKGPAAAALSGSLDAER